MHASIVSTGKPAPGQQFYKSRTYFGGITLYIKEHIVIFSPTNITIDDEYILSWDKITSVSVQDFKISVRARRQVEVYNDKAISLVFALHRVKDDHEYKVNHLGFYVNQGEGFSSDVHGLIGKLDDRMVWSLN